MVCWTWAAPWADSTAGSMEKMMAETMVVVRVVMRVVRKVAAKAAPLVACLVVRTVDLWEVPLAESTVAQSDWSVAKMAGKWAAWKAERKVVLMVDCSAGRLVVHSVA